MNGGHVLRWPAAFKKDFSCSAHLRKRAGTQRTGFEAFSPALYIGCRRSWQKVGDGGFFKWI